MNKSVILENIIKHQTQLLKTLEESVALYKTTSDIDEENTIDPEDLSHQGEAKEMQLHLEERIKTEKTTIQELEKFKNSIQENIQEGALIETGTAFIYLGAALNPFEYEAKEVYCISSDSPLAKSLFHKKTGDNFKIGDTNHTILNIS
ncbi:hypothetical protein [Flavobacterium sp. H122]|uniref:hypothetical protein n=1 Tax=Flavobacterium sp. H122 TaxID=2529860 RepID=UPI0010A9C8C1|nr:hypothetical protein [Flavobacterium sp. H122]